MSASSDQQPAAPPASAAPRGAALDGAAFWILLLFVAVAPFLYTIPSAGPGELPQGTVLPRGDLLLECFAFIVAAATYLSNSPARSLKPLRVPLASAAALMALGLLQLLPLPEDLLGRVAPGNVRIYHESAALLRGSGFPASQVPSARISVSPPATIATILLILAYVALFLASTNVLRNRPRRRIFAATLLGSAIAQVLLVALRYAPNQRLSGLFENPNHFAGYLQIALALAFAAFWAEILVNSGRAPYAGRAEKLEKRFPPLAARIGVWGILAIGIGLTQSRGGLLAAAITSGVLLAAAATHRRAKFRSRIAIVVGTALAAAIIFVAARPGRNPLSRLLESDPREFQNELRVPIWRTSLEAWREFPLLGSGLGTFRDAFRRVQPREIPFLVEHAHSEPLQLLVTGGSLGAGIGLLLFGSLFALLFRSWRGQKHREESALVLAGLGALLSLTIHGLVEFNFSIPVIPATLACVLGAAWAAGRER